MLSWRTPCHEDIDRENFDYSLELPAHILKGLYSEASRLSGSKNLASADLFNLLKAYDAWEGFSDRDVESLYNEAYIVSFAEATRLFVTSKIRGAGNAIYSIDLQLLLVIGAIHQAPDQDVFDLMMRNYRVDLEGVYFEKIQKVARKRRRETVLSRIRAGGGATTTPGASEEGCKKRRQESWS